MLLNESMWRVNLTIVLGIKNLMMMVVVVVATVLVLAAAIEVVMMMWFVMLWGHKWPGTKNETGANWTYFQWSPWSMKTVVEWQQCAVLWPCFITLFEQHLHIWVWSYLWQEPRHQLRGQHVWILPQNCSTQSQGICHQHQLSVTGWEYMLLYS